MEAGSSSGNSNNEEEDDFFSVLAVTGPSTARCTKLGQLQRAVFWG